MKLLFVFGALCLLKTTQGQTSAATEEPGTGTTANPFITPCEGSWTEWSECFPGTDSNPTAFQDRIFILKPSQYEATICNAEHTVNFVQTQPCTTSVLPIQDMETSTCGSDEYQCTNFRCIPSGHRCNGDDDCGDNSDEYPSIKSNCTVPAKRLVCGLSQEPSSSATAPLGERYLTGVPGVEEYAAGFDILSGKFRSNVLSMGGHGSCRRVLIAGITDSYYRIPHNVASLRQIYDVSVDTGKIYESGADLLNVTKAALQYNLNFGGQVLNISGRTGLSQSDFVKGLVSQSVVDDQERSYASVDTAITTAQILLKEASSLELSTEFISRLWDLPYSSFSYSKYMNLIQDFGTHYVSGGKLGGTFKDMEVHSKCWLDSTDYEDYSSQPWRQTVRDCVRQSFFNRLNPDTTTLSNNCQRTTGSGGETTTTLREEAVDYYVFVTGGTVDSSSNLKFSFSKETWDAWVQTIVNSPTLNQNDFTLEKLSSLVWSSSVSMGIDRKKAVAENIDRAIGYYLSPYDALTLCEECPSINTGLSDYTVDGDEIPLFNYGVAYLTGTGDDYKCHCVYDLPNLEDTCGALQNMATLLTLLLSVMAAYWNMIGH